MCEAVLGCGKLGSMGRGFGVEASGLSVEGFRVRVQGSGLRPQD